MAHTLYQYFAKYHQNESWIIVENRDTHFPDCEFRQLGAQEMVQLKAKLPAWAK
jgi:hypothetical protein